MKREILSDLHRLCEAQRIDLNYADEPAVSLEPCVSYGWQFRDEQAGMPSSNGKGVNCFALLTRYNPSLIETTRESTTSQFIFEQFERFSLGIKRPNASGANYQRTNCYMAAARAIYLLPASILAAPEHSRDALAEAEIRMAHAERL